MEQPPASTIDLIILGFLFGKAMNAYELATLIPERKVDRFLKVSTPAVYKNCKRLYADGYLDGEIVKESEQPEKTVYRITAKGRKRFLSLMEHFSSDFPPFFLDCNAFIFHIEKLDKKQGLQMLLLLQEQLVQTHTWLVQHEKEDAKNLSFANRAIVKQYRMVSATLVEWSNEIVRDYKKLK